MTTRYARDFRHPTFTRSSDGGKLPNDTGWQDRHMAALSMPHGFERSIVRMLESWAMYADLHADRYESTIGEDGVLGPAWADIGKGIRVLLNGDCGRLDCGTLDSFIVATLTAEGYGDEIE